ncbi:MAG: hypothetical protein K5675_08800 [Lachnospiraceae bacterium]|nr:hypothetical protein [Lachnospiraceae bacterium]
MIEVVIKGLHEGIMPWDEPKKEEEETSIAVAKPEVEMEEDSYISSEEEAKDKRVSIKNIVDQRKLQSNNTYVYADSMPEGVCSSVLDAVDYGICNSMYLTPEGVTYEKQTSPIFAENMDYYLQTASENDSYFDNALFIGDSRTVGLIDYGDLDDHASFFAKESLSIYDLGTMAVEAKSPSENFGELTIEELLKKKEFKKVYICLGVNELGTGNTLRFYNAYVNLIELIRQYQPKSIIYIQGMMHVTKAYSSTDEIYNNKSIVDKNKAIATLANGHDIFYLDMNETVCDENGDLIEELSTDGVHLLGKNYKIWEDYIKTHVIIRSEADK